MGRIALLTILVLLRFSFCHAITELSVPLPKPPTGRKAPPDRVFKRSTGKEIPPYNTVYHFDQLIDHSNPTLGTFKQRYWHTAEFYESGGPIVLYSPGETNAELHTNALTNRSVTGYMAQMLNGTTVLLEHRFYGLSNPIDDLKGSTLAKYHTIEQAVEDLEYFAKNVKLPMENGGEIAPGMAPWLLTGCSYMGALTAWTMYNNFWRYYEPIREYMPKNCSADVEAVISHVDKTIDSNSNTEIQRLKANFGMANVTNIDDFVANRTSPNFDCPIHSP
ncbi:hypothetical protein AAF712_009928 [Marasmius tenuissimus]|uniref:Uncharacterized protein n=1 Tax=Marasmius tenuissimus TaxID=585030 RepID=A0ABR2ZQY2_9AGAR